VCQGDSGAASLFLEPAALGELENLVERIALVCSGAYVLLAPEENIYLT
jgi:hypothetical protein